MIYYYTYLITNTKQNKFYIGSRQCEIDPIKDLGIKYFSSSHDKDFIRDQKQNPDDYEYIVLGLFSSRDECLKREMELHEAYNVSKNKAFYNRAKQTSSGFNTSGKVTVKDQDGNTMQVPVDDPRFLSGELKHNCKGTVPVKDKNGNTMQVDANDPRYLSGELVHVASGVNKGKVTVKDKDGKTMQVPVDDPRIVSGELVHTNKGMVPVKDKNGNTMQVDANDPRYLSGELVHVATGTVTVKDKDGNTMQVAVDDPRYLSGELVHNFKGTMWINNPTEKKNLKIKKTDTIPDGWVKGKWKKDS